MDFRDLFHRKPDKFLQLLIDQAALTVKGMETLCDYVTNKESDATQRIHQIEEEADGIRRVLITELNRCFITPFDREDIFALSRAIDDVLDYAYTTVDEMNILDVAPNPYVVRMVSLLCDAAVEIHSAILGLKDHPTVASEHARKAKSIENCVESVYREAIAELFKMPQDMSHIMEMLKLRETYRHLSNAADRGDEAANIINDIIVKMT